MPQPPRSAFAAPPPKQTPRLEFVPGSAPDLAPNPPTTPGGGGVPAGGGLVVIDNHAVTPPGASIHPAVPEPTTAIHRDTAFYTGNSFAAISLSSGRTWTHVNPFTTFPASDGGFCCDQSALYIQGNDSNCMLIWQLQYGFSATTGSGRYRIAVAVGRDAIQRRAFHFYDLAPQLVGFPTNRWFDFPDVGQTNNWLYVAANVFDGGNAFHGTAVIRLNLNDMRAGRGAAFHAATTGLLDPASHRLCDGTTHTMYYGAHHRSIFGAPMIRIFSWPETSTSVTFTDRAISAWYTGASSAPGPDHRDWLGNDDHRILGAYLASGAISFMWGSNRGGPFPMPFVRIAGFAESNFNLIGEASVWSPTIAWAYPSVATNAAGNVGGTMCFGGGASLPSTAAWVVDGLSGWGPMTHTVVASGWSGPPQNVWGDYMSATRHPSYPNTYVASAFSIDATNSMTPRYAWFGRQNDVPNFATVNVTSTPITGVAVTVDVPDRNGNQNGTTNFSRVYSAVQGMSWTAPAQVTSGGAAYSFERWVLNGTPQSAGQTALTITDLGGVITNSLQARYGRVRHTLTIDSTPTNGASINATPADVNGRSSGNTELTLVYEDGIAFSLGASIVHNGALFDRWIVDGVPQQPGLVTFNGTARRSVRMTAAYRVPVCGSFTPYFTSCNTRFPGLTHVGRSPRATCGPWVNEQVTYAVEFASLHSAAALFLGGSRRLWNGLLLPLEVPNLPGCFIYTDMVVTIGFGVDGSGNGGVTLTLPNNPGLVNARLYTQCMIVPPIASVQFSNGVETLIGGFP